MSDYHVIKAAVPLKPWQVVLGCLPQLSVYASYKTREAAVASATALNGGKPPKVTDEAVAAHSHWSRSGFAKARF